MTDYERDALKKFDKIEDRLTAIADALKELSKAQKKPAAAKKPTAETEK
jgi:hypothetical protein